MLLPAARADTTTPSTPPPASFAVPVRLDVGAWAPVNAALVPSAITNTASAGRLAIMDVSRRYSTDACNRVSSNGRVALASPHAETHRPPSADRARAAVRAGEGDAHPRYARDARRPGGDSRERHAAAPHPSRGALARVRHHRRADGPAHRRGADRPPRPLAGALLQGRHDARVPQSKRSNRAMD